MESVPLIREASLRIRLFRHEAKLTQGRAGAQVEVAQSSFHYFETSQIAAGRRTAKRFKRWTGGFVVDEHWDNMVLDSEDLRTKLRRELNDSPSAQQALEHARVAATTPTPEAA